ncbi:hypothetical protein NHX12_020635 [Muraenolepis orangiensis]|uniref:Uncharacterized protein n=1 Tax=Muraenolepis orangiensis TaxID=630683 RepID=A0A9Q0ERV8_9TELE|nr:hypothetical protein NHX12_020635 [Muraenolepis orangiensis]
MSDVRLSTASPTLERGIGVGVGDQRRPAEPTKPSVCRNLFGDRADGDGVSGLREEDAWCKATMHTAQRAFAERWDYDPVADRPLLRCPPGAGGVGCQWEAVESPPEFYVRPAHGRPARPPPRGEGAAPGRDHRPEPGEDGRPPDCEEPQGSRKRRAGPLDGCSSRSRTKHPPSDEEEEEEEEETATSHQTATESRPQHPRSRPRGSPRAETRSAEPRWRRRR